MIELSTADDDPRAADTLACDGLFRSALAGPGAGLLETFNALRRHGSCVFAPGMNVYGMNVTVPGTANEGRWKMISLRDEMFVVLSHCHFATPRSEVVPPQDFVDLHFLVSGPADVGLQERDAVHVSAPSLMVCYQGAGLQYRVTCPAGAWQACSLYVTRRYFNRVLHAYAGRADALLARLSSVRASQIYHLQMSLGLDALHDVQRVLSHGYTGSRELLYVEARCTEILYAGIDAWLAQLDENPASQILSSRDLLLIAKARDLIVADLERPMTIPEIARAVGTNSSKLKRGFKFLYGVTIFEFSLRCRMQAALRLLVHERQPVGQVALAVGYQHQTSFATSFRDFYGFSPRDARRLTRSVPANAGDDVFQDADT